MGYIAVILIVAPVVYLFYVLAFRQPRRFEIERMEQVDLIEGGSLVEQQKNGRERWRRAEVDLPARPLTFEEQLNLASIQRAKNQNVRIKRD